MDITVLCETWLTTTIVHRIAGVRALQTPLAPHQGVLLVLGERVTDVQPVVPGLWSPRLIVAKVHIGDLNDRITVVGHYSPPGERAASDKELMYAVKVLSEQGQAKHLVVAGDLNRSCEDARALASKLNLVLAQTQNHVLVTHVNSRNQHHSNQLDYILSNTKSFAGTRTHPQVTRVSDHIPLSTLLEVEPRPRASNASKFHMQTRLKQNLEAKKIESVLLHPQWPHMPFMDVASQLGLTYKVRVQKDVTVQLRRYVNNTLTKHKDKIAIVEYCKEALIKDARRALFDKVFKGTQCTEDQESQEQTASQTAEARNLADAQRQANHSARDNSNASDSKQSAKQQGKGFDDALKEAQRFRRIVSRAARVAPASLVNTILSTL